MKLATFGRVKFLSRVLRRLGFRAGLKWYCVYQANRHRLLRRPFVTMRPRALRFPIEVRIQGSSDVNVFQQIFVLKEACYIDRLGPVESVIDLGANVGYLSALILSRFPRARVIAVEPDPVNARLCRRNLAPYGSRASVIEGAAWWSKSRLTLVRGQFGDGREWATQVREAGPGEAGDVEGWDIETILDGFGMEKVDLLKIDIEGSERDLFERGAGEWLDRIRNLSIELHGTACEVAYRRALSSFEYESLSCGEYELAMGLHRNRLQGEGEGVASFSTQDRGEVGARQ